jgi:branched-chain amino acid transport system substrate-binding protein
MTRPGRLALLLGLLAVSGCAVPGSASRQVLAAVTIAADLPLSGDDAPDGLPVRHAFELAIKQAGLVCGAASHQDACLQLKAVADDDVSKGIHDPARGASNIQQLVDDPAVVALIGPLYDSLAKSELPVANAAQLALVSPAVTDECLTQEPPDGHCHGLAARLRPRSPNNFFRVVTTQLVEGTAAADLAFIRLGKHRAFVVNDQSGFGQSLAAAFAERFTQDGGVIVDPSDLGAFDPSQPADFGGRFDRDSLLAADVVYFAGTEIGAAAALRRDMIGQGLPVPFIGTNRLANSQFARLAGAGARGSYYLVVAPDPAAIRSAAPFIRDYRTAYGQQPTSVSLAAFDATNIVIRALARAIDDAGGKRPTRDQLLTAIARTSDDSGAMGVMSFDGRGDTSLKLLAAYQWAAPTEPSGQFVANLVLR